MKDELLELIEGLDQQIGGYVKTDDPNHYALTLIRDSLDLIRRRLSNLELSEHQRSLREAGIELPA